MRWNVRATIVVALAWGGVSPVLAQTRSSAIILSAPPGTRVLTTGQPLVDLSAPVETLLVGSFPAPGLGFDFTHLAAVNRDLGVRALIDPVTQHQLALARQIRRETPIVPFTAPLVFNSTQVILIQQPPVVILQQPEAPGNTVVRAASEAPAERAERIRAPEVGIRAEPLAETRPLPEAGELVLVRRDGALLFAVAFLVHNQRMVYITPEGNRRFLSLAELDLDATQQMNEARGTPLRLSP